MKFVYPAIFKQEENKKVSVRFPDLDQCVAEGRDFEEALEQAKEAARNWITLELEENADLPPISELDELVCGPDEHAGNVAITVRLTEGYDE